MIPPAFAQDAAAGGGAAIIMQVLPLILIFGVFYFLLIRPQQRKQKEHRAMLAGVKRGDQIYFGGGIRGRVVTAKEGTDEIEVEVAPTLRLTVLRGAVTDILRPVGANDDKAPGKAAANG